MHHAILASIGGFALSSSPMLHAVHQNPHGTGQVLMYPYYTVRDGYVTALAVTNTQENHKLLKVRFLEGKNGREVMDLHVFLGPLDTWTAGVVATAGAARVISGDNSCVTPADLFTETRTLAGGVAINEFRNSDYTGARVDSALFSSLDRTREGFIEVIEMGVIDNDNVEGNALTGAAATLANLLKPGTNGVPADCGAVAAYEVSAGNNAPIQFPNLGANLLAPPRGGLMGRASLIQSQNGSNYTYDATALDGWSNRVAYGALGSGRPQLSEASPAASLVLTPAGVVASAWPDTAAGQRDAVSAVFMRRGISNEYILDTNTASQTEWLVSHPTKRYYVDTGPGPAIRPFANNFSTGSVGSCDCHSVRVFDRDAAIPKPLPPLPCPATGCPPAVFICGSQTCWAGNTIPFQSTSLYGSFNVNALISSVRSFVSGSTTVPGARVSPGLRTPDQGPNGRYEMRFDAASQELRALRAQLFASDGQTLPLQGLHMGLPVFGFMLHNYRNAGVASQYGGLLAHTSTHNIQ